jgi:pyruvate/2-oxoglutarate dehydrogenase complex dihydrolipoamide acyltransferase (E2) component
MLPAAQNNAISTAFYSMRASFVEVKTKDADRGASAAHRWMRIASCPPAFAPRSSHPNTANRPSRRRRRISARLPEPAPRSALPAQGAPARAHPARRRSKVCGCAAMRRTASGPIAARHLQRWQGQVLSAPAARRAALAAGQRNRPQLDPGSAPHVRVPAAMRMKTADCAAAWWPPPARAASLPVRRRRARDPAPRLPPARAPQMEPFQAPVDWRLPPGAAVRFWTVLLLPE